MRGKSLAGMLSLGPAMLAVFLASLPILYWHPRAWPVIGSALMTLCVCVFLCTTMGMAISLMARKTNVALVAGLAACFLLFVGPVVMSEFVHTEVPLRYSLIFGFRANLSDSHPDYHIWRQSLFFHTTLAFAILAYADLPVPIPADAGPMSEDRTHTRPLLERAVAAAPFLTLVRREFVRMLRRTRPFVFLLLLACIAGLLVAANYPPLRATPFVMGSYNESMVSSLVVALFIAALVLLPAYGAASIQSERARNTYDLLTLSLIRPSGIVFAKVISTLGYFCLLVVAVLPFLGVSFFLVGVDWQTIIQSGIVILIAALTCAIVGVLASAHCRGPVAAVILGYFTTFVVIGGYLIVLAVIFVPMAMDLNIGPSSWLEPVAIGVMMTSPVAALAMILAQNVPGWGILATVIGQGLVWGIAVRIATRRLRKPDEPPQPVELDELPASKENRSGGAIRPPYAGTHQ